MNFTGDTVTIKRYCELQFLRTACLQIVTFYAISFLVAELYSYKLVKMMSLCVRLLTMVAQIVTAAQTCILACTDLQMNPGCTPKN